MKRRLVSPSRRREQDLNQEVVDLRKLDHDYQALAAYLQTLQQKYDKLLQEKQQSEREQTLKQQKDSQLLLQLNQQIHVLSDEIQQNVEDIDQANRAAQALRKLSQNKQRQIQLLKRQIAAHESKIQRARVDSSSYFATLKVLRQEKNQLQQKIMMTKRRIDEVLTKRRNLQRESKKRQGQNMRLDKRVYDLQVQRAQLQADNKSRQAELKRKKIELTQVEKEFDCKVNSLRTLEQSSLDLQQDLENNKKILDLEMSRGRQLTSSLSDWESQLKKFQRQISQLLTRRNNQLGKHQKLMAQNVQLDRQLQSNISIIRQLQDVNQNLVQDVKEFCAADQKVRQTLSRTGRLEETLRNVKDRISNTQRQIQHILS